MSKYNFINLILALIFIIITLNLKKIDNKYFNEKIKDFVGKHFYKEIWFNLNSKELNYNWINKYSIIVHGLEVLANENSCEIHTNINNFNLFELNIISEQNNLIVMNNNHRCDKKVILDLINKKNFLIIDIKDDFDKTSDLILNFAKKNNIVDKLIFQLYQPGDLIKFFDKKKQFDTLPGPLITSYKSRRSIDYLTKISLINKIKVLTIPKSKSKYFFKSSELFYFTHSVYNCESFFRIRKIKKISGIYLDPNIKCLN